MRREEPASASIPGITVAVEGRTDGPHEAPCGISPSMTEVWAHAATPPASALTRTARFVSSGNHPASSTDTDFPAGTRTCWAPSPILPDPP